jgi:methylated-DNA-protein-cysteine methyltransferase related protein
MVPARDDDRVQRIRATIDSIPAGRVATYGQIAELAGLPGRARLVGRTLRELESGTQLPWHRVIGADGRLHTAATAAREQARRLRSEGVLVDPRGRVALARFRFDGG